MNWVFDIGDKDEKLGKICLFGCPFWDIMRDLVG